jgi:hypothetical protein
MSPLFHCPPIKVFFYIFKVKKKAQQKSQDLKQLFAMDCRCLRIKYGKPQKQFRCGKKAADFNELKNVR